MSHRILTSAVQRLRRLLGPRPAAESGDEQLLDRFALDGDQEAFAILVERHGPMVLGVGRRVLGDVHRAEDAFQATFLILARKAATLDRTRPLAGWLHTVAQRAALRARAGDARRQRVEEQAVNRERIAHRYEPPWSDIAPLLDDELGRLPEKYRVPLVLCYLQGATHEQAAAQLGWPVGTVRGRLARARDVLRNRLARRGLAVSAAALAAQLTENVMAAPVSVALTRTMLATLADAGSAPAALSLAEGVLRAMVLHRLQWIAVVLVTAGLLTATAWLVRPSAIMPVAMAVPVTPRPDEAPRLTEGQLSLLGVRSGLHVVNGRKELIKPELAVVTQVPPGKDEAALAWFDGPDGPKPARALRLVGEKEAPQKAPVDTSFTPLAPRAGVRTAVLLASPMCQARDDGTVATLTRQKNRFTLTVQTWADNGPYWGNRLSQKLELVPLGELEAGDYELHVVQDDLFQDFSRQPQDGHYQLRDRQAATLKFSVAARDATPGSSQLPTLKRDRLGPAGMTAEERGRAYQFPRSHRFCLEGNAKKDPAPSSAFQVGTLDLSRWEATLKPGEQRVPRVEPPTLDVPWYAVVVGCEVPCSGGVSLREVEWRGKQAILRMDLWIDPPVAGQKTGLAMAVIPLAPERRWVEGRGVAIAGDYTIRTEWSVWKAAAASGPYRQVSPADVKRYLPGAGSERYEAKFAIR